MCVRVWVMWLFITKKHTSRVITKSGLNMCCRDIWKDMYFEMHARHHELNVCNAHQTSWAELKTWKQNVDMANLFYFNTPSFVVPTTLNPAMAKTHRSRHWAKYVSSYPTSLDNKIPTTSLVLQGKFSWGAKRRANLLTLCLLWLPLETFGFYFPPHSGFGHPMHRWQQCFHLLL